MFSPFHNIQLGPINLSMDMIAIISSLLVGYLVISFLLKLSFEEENVRAMILDTLQISILVFVITYKFWPIVLTPSYLLSPTNILLYSGGPWAIEAGLTFAFGWLLIKWYKKKWPIKLIDIFAIGGVSGIIFSHLLVKQYGVQSFLTIGWKLNETVYHPINIYMAILLSAFLLFNIQWFRMKRAGTVAIGLVVGYIITAYLLQPLAV
ncbi:hypothetical protein [Bacillus sp. FJAT-45350]|uniref:hypothetical protein n=1 Tax=Bacillus sp. FJAT-45350 TaxID=2011014 RepID=UPI000BB9755C|nr:hypothetical protein [Bacillus sp. FJAT-45350]